MKHLGQCHSYESLFWSLSEITMFLGKHCSTALCWVRGPKETAVCNKIIKIPGDTKHMIVHWNVLDEKK